MNSTEKELSWAFEFASGITTVLGGSGGCLGSVVFEVISIGKVEYRPSLVPGHTGLFLELSSMALVLDKGIINGS